MDYHDLGYNSFGIKTLTNNVRQTPQQIRNNSAFGALTASSVYVGSNDDVFKADESGIYLGNAVFTDAPFKVDMSGNAVLRSASITATDTTITPGVDAGEVFRINQADGTQVFLVDTTNGWVQVGQTIPPTNNDPNVNLYVTKDVDSYFAINFQNLNAGEFASTDFVILNDDTTANSYEAGITSGYVDLGVNSTGWNDPDYALFDAQAEFLDVGNNLYLGTSGTTHSIFFYTGGHDSKDYIRASINPQGVFFPFSAPTASAPDYVEGGMYYDTTTHKLTIGGVAGWETVTSVAV